MKINSTLLCLLLMLGAGSFTTAKAQAVNVNDSLALVDLYNSTNGHGWRYNENWLTTKPVSTWHGVTVTATRVTSLNLGNNKLNGTIPSSIGNLVKLTYLNLYGNTISGTIPASIGNLVNLQFLILYGNTLSGTIPVAVGNLVKLDTLQLGHNMLSGTIPASIGNLANLEDLELYNNQLSGTIPASIGNLANLQFLELYQNDLTGTIPAQIGNLTNLQQLGLYRTQLSGSIPSSLGNLVKLTDLYLQSNQLSGTIPSSLGNLVKLIVVALDHNKLHGTIPASFNKLTSLFNIDLSYNQLSTFGNASPFYNNPNLQGNVSHNLFTFTGLQSIATKHPNIVYAPQNTILPIHQNGNTLSVSAGGTLDKNTYKWFKVGATDSTIKKGDSTFTPSASGMYYVKVTNAVAKELILISDTISYTMPLAQTKNSIANIAALKTATNHFSVYPNPASNSIHIQTNGTATITLTNSDGKTLLTKTINNNDAINISSFANGTYYLQNKTTGETQKIVVVH